MFYRLIYVIKQKFCKDFNRILIAEKISLRKYKSVRIKVLEIMEFYDIVFFPCSPCAPYVHGQFQFQEPSLRMQHTRLREAIRTQRACGRTGWSRHACTWLCSRAYKHRVEIATARSWAALPVVLNNFIGEEIENLWDEWVGRDLRKCRRGIVMRSCLRLTYLCCAQNKLRRLFMLIK